ncbi:hypothetical protein [Microvirga sp. M2]|uniref:hypothetical protein n=1 Tax=Microvirga sp. M2 TaxID=3073270 RepID=UPI0039C1BF04
MRKGAILQRFGQLLIRWIVPDGQQQSPEQGQRWPGEFAFGSGINIGHVPIQGRPVN